MNEDGRVTMMSASVEKSGEEEEEEAHEEMPDYIHIRQNEFLHRKHKKQKDEDVAICQCERDGEGEGCVEGCLNVLTNTECTPEMCPTGLCCTNQRFQKCLYSPTRLFRTPSRGWGLAAAKPISAGSFIIEYCGEVISCKQAKRRSQAYHLQGISDAYIISLNGSESIDATKKGSLARFINHSCQPNCETRKWNVLGEIRVGIFAKQDIEEETELSYDYNFQWYGGPKVRCLCGADSCSGFLGAKSRGFQEDTYLWEDDDDRYSVEKIPLYDSAEDDEEITKMTAATTTIVEVKLVEEADKVLTLKKKKRSKRSYNGKLKILAAANQVDGKAAALLLSSKEAKEEVLGFEETKKEANARLDSVYDEIRPAIEEHERVNQDNVSTTVAEKWIEASCAKFRADFDLCFSIVKNFVVPKPALDMDLDLQAQF